MGELVGQEVVVELRVVRDEDPTAEQGPHLRRDLLEGGRTGETLGSETVDVHRAGVAARVEEGGVLPVCRPCGSSVTMARDSTRSRPGRSPEVSTSTSAQSWKYSDWVGHLSSDDNRTIGRFPSPGAASGEPLLRPSRPVGDDQPGGIFAREVRDT